MSYCRSCGASIFWARTEKGKLIPLDERARDDGTIIVRFDDELRAIVGVPADAFPGEPLYVSHFATCPQAERWRRP